MTTTYKSIDNQTQTKMLSSIYKRGTKLNDDAVELANGFLLHFIEHGDMTNAMKIADVIGEVWKSPARKAFIDWVQAFTPNLRWNEKEKTLEYRKPPQGKQRELVTHNESHHYEVPFFDFIPEATPKNFDIVKRVQSLIAQAKNKADEGLLVDENNFLTELEKIVPQTEPSH